jgi:hypothetical protein
VLSPRITSSLFPQLPSRSRNSFRAGLLVVALTLAGSAVLRGQAAMIATATCGLLLLFALSASDRPSAGTSSWRRSSVRGWRRWALIAGPIVTVAYRAALGSHTDLSHVLFSGWPS